MQMFRTALGKWGQTYQLTAGNKKTGPQQCLVVAHPTELIGGSCAEKPYFALGHEAGGDVATAFGELS